MRWYAGPGPSRHPLVDRSAWRVHGLWHTRIGETVVTLEALRAGDPRALEALLQDVWAPLVRHLTGVTGSRDTAQDAAQEAFVRLWERRERWQRSSPRWRCATSARPVR